MKKGEHKMVLKMPRWGLPLYGQVLVWFFVNVAVVLSVLWLVLKLQFGIDPAEFLSNRLQDEVEERADLISRELRESSREEWGEILSRNGEALGLQLAIYSADGVWEGEEGVSVSLRERVSEVLQNVGEPLEGPPPRGPKEDRFDDFDDFGGGLLELPARGQEGSGRRERPRPRGEVPAAELLFVRGADETRDSRRWAAVRVHLPSERYRHPPDGVLVFYAEKLGEDEIFVDVRPLIVVTLGLLLLSGVMWLPFVHVVKKRLHVMTEGAERISEGDFAVSVASRRGDELGRLSRVIQRMAERLNVLVDGQKRFLGDTAHELCSPLARMRMGLGVLEHRLEGADRERLQAVEEEVGELARLVDELLDFSKASLSKSKEAFQPCLLRQLSEEVCQREVVSGQYRITGGADLEVSTNPDLFKRALGNVVRNAVRYAGGKDLDLVIESHSSEAWIGVLDRGPGLPEGWSERVFEPFARPDAARTREGGGAGLGLAIVKTCMESLGGRVFCRNRQTGGLEVVLVLPNAESQKAR